MAAAKATKRDTEAKAVLDRIESFDEPHRTVAARVHEVVVAAVPELRPKLWYGMPGYHLGGPTVVFFRVDDGVMSFGITEKANIAVDDGAPDRLVGGSWYLDGLDAPTEERLSAIVRRAAG